MSLQLGPNVTGNLSASDCGKGCVKALDTTQSSGASNVNSDNGNGSGQAPANTGYCPPVLGSGGGGGGGNGGSCH